MVRRGNTIATKVVIPSPHGTPPPSPSLNLRPLLPSRLSSPRPQPLASATPHHHNHHHDPHHDHGHVHGHPHRHHHHHGGIDDAGGGGLGLQRRLWEFARAIKWVDAADVLRENLGLCCCSARLFLAATVSPYEVPKGLVGPVCTSLMLLAFPPAGGILLKGGHVLDALSHPILHRQITPSYIPDETERFLALSGIILASLPSVLRFLPLWLAVLYTRAEPYLSVLLIRKKDLTSLSQLCPCSQQSHLVMKAGLDLSARTTADIPRHMVEIQDRHGHTAAV
ncbi:hypothetical protein MLD38_028561 [Melastoma candidum]|uniref:Uncharacterized protein n=1 Tax=Melastoma candidum TaxID=119954 RepID=A0ACB9N1Y7_9MYRT|nr:hypothetical protein MLD38_028561 [Melastoma candidum]